MKLLHQIGDRKYGSNFNTPQEVLRCDDPLSFDGVYKSIMPLADYLRAKRNVYLFFMGSYVGKDNSFDVGQPLSKYCDWDDLHFLVYNIGANLGFHSWTHRDLTTLSDDEVRKEITPPFRMDYFAYPHGRVDARVARLVEEAGYKEAWAAGPHGDGSRFQRKRSYLNW